MGWVAWEGQEKTSEQDRWGKWCKEKENHMAKGATVASGRTGEWSYSVLCSVVHARQVRRAEKHFLPTQNKKQSSLHFQCKKEVLLILILLL